MKRFFFDSSEVRRRLSHGDFLKYQQTLQENQEILMERLEQEKEFDVELPLHADDSVLFHFRRLHDSSVKVSMPSKAG
ncbi:hypothetical protein [Alkalicoccus chagannorensis]|uniref:hypothetical protein n=1 Tax=Alkalicoccus chagannorensis TaxID=427072 RepID=UPI0004099C28|nr:hypothetical protein [Alkalicoccus chagannorensis]